MESNHWRELDVASIEASPLIEKDRLSSSKIGIDDNSTPKVLEILGIIDSLMYWVATSITHTLQSCMERFDRLPRDIGRKGRDKHPYEQRYVRFLILPMDCESDTRMSQAQSSTSYGSVFPCLQLSKLYAKQLQLYASEL